MRNLRLPLGLIGALALLPAPSPGVAASAKGDPSGPLHIVIGLDLSKSNPLVSDKDYASKVAQRIGPEIKNLAPRSLVQLRTFGVYDPSAQNLRVDFVISSKNPTEEVATVVTGIIAGIPTLVQTGKLKVQMKTNIVPFLENMAEVVDCDAQDTKVILVTDGIEDSEYAKLISAQGQLPPPDKRLYRGCSSMQILGLGVGANSPSLTKHLREEWKGWADKAGFDEFEGLNDW